MEREAIRNSTGFIQVQGHGYWEDKTIDNTFEETKRLYSKIESIENVSSIIPRLESFALVSLGNITKGVKIIGTDPEIENDATKLKDRVIEGKYFSKHYGVRSKNEVFEN